MGQERKSRGAVAAECSKTEACAGRLCGAGGASADPCRGLLLQLRVCAQNCMMKAEARGKHAACRASCAARDVCSPACLSVLFERCVTRAGFTAHPGRCTPAGGRQRQRKGGDPDSRDKGSRAAQRQQAHAGGGKGDGLNPARPARDEGQLSGTMPASKPRPILHHRQPHKAYPDRLLNPI